MARTWLDRIPVGPAIADIAGRRFAWIVAAGALVVAVAAVLEDRVGQALWFVVQNLVEVAPLLIPGILVAGWASASGIGERIAGRLTGRMPVMIVVASAIGAVTPVCGVMVLPLMVSLLAAGMPLAVAMAFWLSSPVTDPAMMAATAAMLGWEFAVGKTVAAFCLGLLGGVLFSCVGPASWTTDPLRANRVAGRFGRQAACMPAEFRPLIWKSPSGRAEFRRQVLAMTRLILICLVPAFLAEHVLAAILEPTALVALAGEDSPWAIPLAVLVGAPAYLEGYAALPLVRVLIAHGMSSGAAMAFLVAGGVISVWGAVAIAPVLKWQPFLIYLVAALAGSALAGWCYGSLLAM